MSRTHAFIAANRFGLGARPGEIARSGPDDLHDQLAAPDDARLTGLSVSRDLVEEGVRQRRMGRLSQEERRARREEARALYQDEAAAHATAAVGTRTPLRERMVAHWANHFTVSVQRREIVGLAWTFEREAIRAHVFGRFEDMLFAAVTHPAMQLYLDNFRSTGPDSRAGQRRALGLNENLAREVLELHTLGVDGGYTQDDVEALAAILTGWSLDGFDPRRHQPGAKTLLHTRYPEGRDALPRALSDLARHPSTAHHVARRLGAPFAADPDAIAKVFLDTEGDLAAVTAALIDAREVWHEPLARIKTPRDLVLSTARAVDYRGDGTNLVRAMQLLGQFPLGAPSPAGWPDEDEAWTGPEAVLQRLDFAQAVGDKVPVDDPVALADDVLGPVLTRQTRRALTRAVPSTALALLVASPEFQRR